MAKGEEKTVPKSGAHSGTYTPLAGVDIAARTDIGRRREENQDNFVLIEKEKYKLLVVADGMGGARGGAVAASMAVLTMQEQFKGVREISVQKLNHAIAVANSRIYDESNDKPKLAGMGTTIVCVAITKDSIFVAHVGDSRAYRLRDGIMQKLTDDHTLVNELLRTGAITADQAEHHPVSHMLTRSLGTGAEIDIDCRELKEPPRKGDKFILMSDGLYNLVTRQEIFKELSKARPLTECVDNLIDLANERGGTDNITIVTAALDEPFDAAPPEEKLEADIEKTEEIREPVQSSEPAPSVHFGISNTAAHWPKKASGISSYRVPLIPVIIIFLAAFGWGVKLSLLREHQNPLDIRDVTEDLHPLTAAESRTVQQIDSHHDDAIPLTDVSRPRRMIHEEGLIELKRQKELLTLTSASAQEKIKKSIEERKAKNAVQREEILQNKERATRKLAAWYSRKKRLETTEAINLAREISAIADSVKAKREAFEEVTWRYFKEAEALRYNPGDASVKERVAQILTERRAAFDAVGVEVKNTIDTMILEAEHDLASLTEKEDLLSQDDSALIEEERILALLQTNDTAALTRKAQEIDMLIQDSSEQLKILNQKNQEFDELSAVFPKRSAQ